MRLIPTFAAVVGFGQLRQRLCILVPGEDIEAGKEAGAPEVVAAIGIIINM